MSYEVVTITPWSADNFPSRTPTTWKLQGSNNGSDWQDLGSRTVSSGSWTINTPTRFTFSNSTAYLYYRLYITANGGNGYTGIRLLKLMGLGTSIGLFLRDSSGNVKQITTI